MKTSIALICVCILTIFSPGAKAGEREDAIAFVDNALVLVRQTCVFTLNLKTGDETKITTIETMGGMGTGFFIDKPQKKPNYFNILSAGHVVDCSLRWYTKRLETVVPYGFNALELKSTALKTEIKYKDVWYSAFVENLKFGGLYPDYALLLTTELPENTIPYLIPYGLRRGEYKVGSPVVFRGFMVVGGDSEFNGSGNSMMIMMDEAVIQYLGKNFFRIAMTAHPGNSGSPVLFWKDRKYYAIGIVSAGYEFKSAIITDLDFANNTDETAPK